MPLMMEAELEILIRFQKFYRDPAVASWQTVLPVIVKILP